MPTPSQNPVVKAIVNSLGKVLYALMQQFDVPGGQIAVLVGEDLYQVNLGWAVNGTVPVNSSSVFRVASNSKPFTATAIMRLWQEGKLSLDDTPFCDPAIPGCELYCDKPGILASTIKMPDNLTIAFDQCVVTIRNLLEMSAGFCEHPPIPGSACNTLPGVDNLDFDASYDALDLYGFNISSSATPPASLLQLIGRYLALRTQYTPGSDWNYCNSCHDILSQIVTAIAGKPYEQFVLSLLKPYNITSPALGNVIIPLPNEVTYYAEPPYPVPSIIPPFPDMTNDNVRPPPYGGYFDVEQLPGCGGWVMSATDMARFIRAMGEPRQFFTPGRKGILNPETIVEMFKRPHIPLFKNASHWPGMGFDNIGQLIHNTTSSYLVLKNGELAGTNSWLFFVGPTMSGMPSIILAFVINSNINATNATTYVYDQLRNAVIAIWTNSSFSPTPSPTPTFERKVGKAFYGRGAPYEDDIQQLVDIQKLLHVTSSKYFFSRLQHDAVLAGLTTLITSLFARCGVNKNYSTLAVQICHIAFLAAAGELKSSHMTVHVMGLLGCALGLSYSRAVQLSQLINLAFSIGYWMPTNLVGLAVCVTMIVTSMIGSKFGAQAVSGVANMVLGTISDSNSEIGENAEVVSNPKGMDASVGSPQTKFFARTAGNKSTELAFADMNGVYREHLTEVLPAMP